MPGKTDFIALVAGALTSLSLSFQLMTTIRLYKQNKKQSGLSNLFLIVTLVGQILWLYWAIDLFIETETERGAFSILWSTIVIILISSIILVRNNFFRDTKTNRHFELL